MIPINRTYAPLQAFVEELYRCGMRHAVTSPGSRNAPLALTLAAQDGVEAVSVLDERSAGFVALGMAKASGRPVAVTCTSGTAAANLHPAVVEAWEARVPLIVLSADRPPELREVGAGQAIDQIKLYGSAAKWFVEVGNHDPGPRDRRAPPCPRLPRVLDRRAAAGPGPCTSTSRCASRWRRRRSSSTRPTGRAARRAALDRGARALERAAFRRRARVAARIADEPRGVIVCGPTDERIAEPAARLAAETGWPMLAEPTSGVRCGEHDRSHVIAHYDVLLRIEEFAAGHAPGLVLRVGDMPTSKPLRAFVAASSQIVIDPYGAWHEPTRTAELVLQAAAAPTLDALASAVEMRPERARRAGSGLAGGGRQGLARGRGGAGRLRGQVPRHARAGAARRRDRLGELLDADPRRGGVLPPVAQAAALPREPRRERDRRRRVVRHGRGARDRPGRPGC